MSKPPVISALELEKIIIQNRRSMSPSSVSWEYVFFNVQTRVNEGDHIGATQEIDSDQWRDVHDFQMKTLTIN